MNACRAAIAVLLLLTAPAGLGCVGLSEFRKLQYEVRELKSERGTRVADLSAEIEVLREEISQLEGRVEAAERRPQRPAKVSAAGGAVQHRAVRTADTRTMDFGACLAFTERTIAALNVPANRIIPIVNTGILRVTKVVAEDGNVIISCSKPDRKLVITESTPPDLHLLK
jgi:hypothetical protein